MSYHNLTPDTYTPRELADEINIDVEKGRHEVDTLTSIVVALEETQRLSGDDSAKWEALSHLVQALNDLEPNLQVNVEKETGAIKVSIPEN